MEDDLRRKNVNHSELFDEESLSLNGVLQALLQYNKIELNYENWSDEPGVFLIGIEFDSQQCMGEGTSVSEAKNNAVFEFLSKFELDKTEDLKELIQYSMAIHEATRIAKKLELPLECIKRKGLEYCFTIVLGEKQPRYKGRDKKPFRAKGLAYQQAYEYLKTMDKPVIEVVEGWVADQNPRPSDEDAEKTALAVLREMAARRRAALDFQETDERGPAHKKVFQYRCTFGTKVTVAEARSKKTAKQVAAEMMIKKLRCEPTPDIILIKDGPEPPPKPKDKRWRPPPGADWHGEPSEPERAGPSTPLPVTFRPGSGVDRQRVGPVLDRVPRGEATPSKVPIAFPPYPSAEGYRAIDTFRPRDPRLRRSRSPSPPTDRCFTSFSSNRKLNTESPTRRPILDRAPYAGASSSMMRNPFAPHPEGVNRTEDTFRPREPTFRRRSRSRSRSPPTPTKKLITDSPTRRGGSRSPLVSPRGSRSPLVSPRGMRPGLRGMKPVSSRKRRPDFDNVEPASQEVLEKRKARFSSSHIIQPSPSRRVENPTEIPSAPREMVTNIEECSSDSVQTPASPEVGLVPSLVSPRGTVQDFEIPEPSSALWAAVDQDLNDVFQSFDIEAQTRTARHSSSVVLNEGTQTSVANPAVASLITATEDYFALALSTDGEVSSEPVPPNPSESEPVTVNSALVRREVMETEPSVPRDVAYQAFSAAVPTPAQHTTVDPIPSAAGTFNLASVKLEPAEKSFPSKKPEPIVFSPALVKREVVEPGQDTPPSAPRNLASSSTVPTPAIAHDKVSANILSLFKPSKTTVDPIPPAPVNLALVKREPPEEPSPSMPLNEPVPVGDPALAMREADLSVLLDLVRQVSSATAYEQLRALILSAWKKTVDSVRPAPVTFSQDSVMREPAVESPDEPEELVMLRPPVVMHEVIDLEDGTCSSVPSNLACSAIVPAPAERTHVVLKSNTVDPVSLEDTRMGRPLVSEPVQIPLEHHDLSEAGKMAMSQIREEWETRIKIPKDVPELILPPWARNL